MKAQGGGSIVNVSSVVGNQAMENQAVYAISKAALDHLTRCLAVEYLEDHIRVNTVIIGGAPTGGAARTFSEVSAVYGRTPDIATFPPSMATTPLDEITDAISFLCSDLSRGVTATALAVDHARSAGAVFSAALKDALAGKWTR
jgi:NAD(P)-dependent dehydrogenase (short-subunit alcohol dehydrogenase family)